jgi:Prolyl oligopeptidase, N-terminal beta-propeller domain
MCFSTLVWRKFVPTLLCQIGAAPGPRGSRADRKSWPHGPFLWTDLYQIIVPSVRPLCVYLPTCQFPSFNLSLYSFFEYVNYPVPWNSPRRCSWRFAWSQSSWSVPLAWRSKVTRDHCYSDFRSIVLKRDRTSLVPKMVFSRITSPSFPTAMLIATGFSSIVDADSLSLKQLYDYERFRVPFRKGNRWYYAYNSGLSPQDVYYTVEGEDAIDRRDRGTVFFDPNTLSDDGTVAVRHTSLQLFWPVVGY